jgi:hypothetical protein
MKVNTEHGGKPAWVEEGSEVCSVDSRVGSDAGVGADTAREVLETAGIPCYLDFCEDPPEEDGAPPTHRWRVLVPGKLNMRATSILDRDIFNDEFEALWRIHLEMLSDQELRDAKPNDVFCGLTDRVERAGRAYNDELARRGLLAK